MQVHQALVESVKVSQSIAPKSVAAAATVGVYVDMRDWDFVDFLISVGAIDAGGTINAVARENTVSSAGSSTDIAGTAITALDDTDDNHIIVISVRKETMTKRYAHVTVTTAVGSAMLISAIAVQYRKTGNTPIVQDTTVAEVVKV
jgi:hypothetical protein